LDFSSDLPATSAAAALFAFNGDILEFRECSALASDFFVTTRYCVRNHPGTLPLGVYRTGPVRPTLVRWAMDPSHWWIEHGASVDAFAALTALERATLEDQRRWGNKPSYIPTHQGEDSQGPFRVPCPPIGLTPCVADTKWSAGAILSLVVQVVGFPHTATRPANPNCWLTLLESMQSTSLGVLTGATHLVLTLPPASAMTDLLSDTLRDIGWEVVLGNGSPGLSPLSCADILQSVPGSGESDTILLQPALWSSAMASTLWAARPEDRQLLAIVQWGVDPWVFSVNVIGL
jgi:hypothetical protein